MVQEGKWRQQLGLDYLKKARKESAAEQQVQQQYRQPAEAMPPYMESALIAHGHRILKALISSPDKTKRLFDLVDELDVAMDTLRPVVDHLEKQGYVETVEEDRKGDHKLGLTKEGVKLAGQI